MFIVGFLCLLSLNVILVAFELADISVQLLPMAIKFLVDIVF